MLCGSHNEIWNLANHVKKKKKKHQNARFIDEKLKTKSLMFFASFFHVICNISNFNMWTANHLAQASWTELTLQGPISFYYIKAFNLVTSCNLVTVFWETKSVTKSRVHYIFKLNQLRIVLNTDLKINAL